MDITIRKANNDDAKKANEFLTKLIQDEKKYDKNINENCIVNNLYENFIGSENNCILIAEDNKKNTVGYLYGYLIDNGDVYIKKSTMLEAMFVDKNYRGEKIGYKLIEEFKKWSKYIKASYIELKVCNDNNSAISLYQKQGFKSVKTTMVLEIGD